jgi:hypothetical protein
MFGDFALCALAALGLIALGLALEFRGWARLSFIAAALCGFAPLLRAFALRLWGAIKR